ncbi:TPA: terminase gpA endonuclease subunit [Vibrio cholerae]|uniref:terminase gpA endonuclease subunit n=1 Tax=Vibrio cholerae TaxID=666 RepID=UPI00226FAF50|nr:terminase gpA endonuclease subunit [Vibrio cholerae]
MVRAKPLRNAAQWATENRIMPPGSPIPGPFDTTSTPYMIPVCVAFADPTYSKITFVMGTQMGKSATMQNVIGWRLDDLPAPIIYVGPTESNINNVVEPKIMEMFRECQSLWIKYDDKSPKHKKRIGGVSLRFAWAGSATELASDSAVITLVDELDRPDANATGEGSLSEIAEARGDAYIDSKLGLTSTPTHGKASTFVHPETGMTHWAVAPKGKVSSPIWLEWEQGTRHEWAVPCPDPDCGEYFIPRSELLWWPGKGTDKECSPAAASRDARLICPHCGGQIEDKHRKLMNAQGVAIAPGQYAKRHDDHSVLITQGDDSAVVPFHSMLHPLEDNNHFSIWVSGLCSFSGKKSYGYLARKLLQAQRSGDPNQLLSVYNTGFGEIFAVVGEAPDWEEVYALRSSYQSGQVPDGVEVLICTVDVQKNRLVYVIRGWMPGMSSRLIEFGELWGDTDKPEVWQELDELVAQEWDGHTIKLTGVDAGYRTEEVYAWVRRHRSRARALMGFQKLPKPFRMMKVEVDKQGKTRKRGDKRWDIDSSLAKSWVHNRVRWKRGAVGDWLLPADVTEDYCKQIVAEEFDEESGTWNRVSKDNHFLDCEGMNYMSARMLRLDRKKIKSDDEEEAEIETAVTDPSEEDEFEEEEQQEAPVRLKRKTKKRLLTRRKKGNFATSW